MAETAVNFVIDKLVPLLTEEAKLLSSIHKELESIRAELQLIQPFLRAADERTERGEINDGMKAWVKQVRKVSYQIEDVIDEYMLHQAQRPQRCGFLSFFRKLTNLIIKLKPQHEIASHIQNIKGKIREIKERGETYGFSAMEPILPSMGATGRNEKWLDPRLDSLFIEEAKVVGIEAPRDELIKQLVEGASNRVVISVVGMAGVGKTTLVKKVYDNQKVTRHFVCHAWIPVSQSYEKDELLIKMMEEFCDSKKEPVPQGLDKMDDTTLIRTVRNYLKNQRYLVVLDDVWDIMFWGFIKNAMPNTDDKGSRVVITTRKDDVAASCRESQFDFVHKLQPLPPDKAWELFCNKAFQSDYGGVCPHALEDLSHDIVKRCGGLPLAIVAVSGILATKQKIVPQWQKFLDSMGSQLGIDPRLTGIKKILSLSYLDLPYYLKSCFLYFSILPEDYYISCVRIIRLWIAEGFVKGTDHKTLEEVAEEYLTELIQRSLVQVSSVNFDGEARTCCVHDLMRDIITSISEDLVFCQILPKPGSSFDGQSRRLSIHNSVNNVLEGIAESRVRSLFWFDEDELPESFMNRLSATFKLLKVMDFENAPLNCLPEEVGNLFHLRYLSLRKTGIKVVPKSIGRLWNLLTLDLKATLVTELPAEINKLHKLRHLLAYHNADTTDFHLDSQQGVKIDEGIGCLEALQKLFFVEANHGPGLIKELRKLRRLRKLGIKKLKSEDGKALCSAIEQMSYLETLDVTSVTKDEILDLQQISVPLRFLRRLYLQGRLEKFPDWICRSKLQNVVRVGLYWSGLTEDPLKFLKDLPCLLELRLIGAYDGESLSFEEGGFQKLKLIKFRYLNSLNSVIIDKAALPELQELQLGPIPEMKEVPSGIQNLRNLTTLRFYDMPDEFLRKVQPKQGQDYQLLQQIANVLLHKSSDRGYDTCTLEDHFLQ